MKLLVILAKKVALVAAGETVRRIVIRWAKGELSLQDGYDRLWRRSIHGSDTHEKLPQAAEPANGADEQ